MHAFALDFATLWRVARRDERSSYRTQWMFAFDNHLVSKRIRGLIAGQDGGNIAATAARLRVAELSLQMAVDELSPEPTAEVLLAIVRDYGVDPMWLITGEYDSATHRRAMEEDHEATALAIGALLRKATPAEIQPPGVLGDLEGTA